MNERAAVSGAILAAVDERSAATTRWIRHIVVAVAAFLVVGLSALLVYSYYDQQQRTSIARDNQRTLSLMLCVLDPKNPQAKGCGPFVAQQALSAAQLAHLVVCLENRIDVDTGRGRRNATCP